MPDIRISRISDGKNQVTQTFLLYCLKSVFPQYSLKNKYLHLWAYFLKYKRKTTDKFIRKHILKQRKRRFHLAG